MLHPHCICWSNNPIDMKNKEKIRVMVPVSMPDLDKTFKNKRWADDARAVIHFMGLEKWKMAINDNYRPTLNRDTGWVSMNATTIRTGIGVGKRFNEILNKLEAHGSLEIMRKEDGSKSYTPGMYSMLYRFRIPAMVNGRKYRQEWITDKKTIANMKTFYNRHYKKQRKIFLDKMKWYQDNLEWAEKMYLDDAALIFAAAQSPQQEEKLLAAISAFNSKTGRYIATCDFAGRIHSWVGGLNKKLRPFIRVEGEDDELLIADVVSAQPTLTAYALNRPCLISELVPEFNPILHKLAKRQHDASTRLFLHDCLQGNLYEKLMEVTGIKDRDKVKRHLFRHLLFSSASNQHKDRKVQKQRLHFRQAFKLLYPSVYDTITSIKRTQSRSLKFVKQLTSKRGKGRMYVTPNMMAQRLEVAILLNMVTKRLNAAGVISVTIHDAWILKKTDLAIFERVVADLFAEMHLTQPKLNIEALNGPTDIIEPGKPEE